LLWYSIIPSSLSYCFSYILVLKRYNNLYLCIGYSVSTETKTQEGDNIVVVSCKTKQDCLRNIRALPCGPSIVSCSAGYCVCNHKNEESGI